MRTAIVLLPELSNAIDASVEHAYDTLNRPALPLDPARGVTGSAAVF